MDKQNRGNVICKIFLKILCGALPALSPLLAHAATPKPPTGLCLGQDCAPPAPPTVTILTPANGATVSGSIGVSGTTLAGSAALSSVQVSVDGGAYGAATGTSPWSYSLDTTGLSNASHTLTARVTDSSGMTATASVAVTVSNGIGGGQTPTIIPRAAAVTLGQPQQFRSNMSVNWSVNGIAGGNSTIGTISSSGLYTPGSAAGNYTVTATNASAPTYSTSAPVAVTSYAGWFTWRNDNQRTGQNLQEIALTTANVNPSQFGKRFACAVDGQLYASPLYVANINVGGKVRNAVYLATQNDSVYAFDADDPSCNQLWFQNFGAPAQSVDLYGSDVSGQDINPSIGITGTPVIDPNTNTLYVDVFTKASGNFTHSLHALDLVSGQDKFGGPVVVSPAGFVAQEHLQRPGLLLANGYIYLAFGSAGDNEPAHGWVVAYNASNLSQVGVLDSTPNGELGSVWQSGGGLAADSSGNVYFATGNGDFNGSFNYSDSIMKVSPTLGVIDYFTPADQQALSDNDLDVGAVGVLLLPDQAGAHPHEMLAGDKDGYLYLVDRDSMTHFNSGGDEIVQELTGICSGYCQFGVPAYWNNNVYGGANYHSLSAYSLSSGLLGTLPSSQSNVGGFGWTPSPVISANGTSNGIVWALNNVGYQPTTPAVLYAFDATNLAKLLYASNQNSSRDAAGNGVKFTVPTVANGKVYVGGNGFLTVYGLLP